MEIDAGHTVARWQRGVDLMIQRDARQQIVIQPGDGVGFIQAGNVRPGYLACRSARFPANARTFPVGNLRRNSHFCFRTDGGKYGRLTYQDTRDGVVSLIYEIWRPR
jgi:hypothetical protein